MPSNPCRKARASIRIVEELERSTREKTMPVGWVQRLWGHRQALDMGVEHLQASELDPDPKALRLQILKGQGLARAEGRKARKPLRNQEVGPVPRLCSHCWQWGATVGG